MKVEFDTGPFEVEKAEPLVVEVRRTGDRE